MQKNNFRLYVRSRGRTVDYSWIGNPPQISTDGLTALQGSLFYTLCIEKKGDQYHEFITVYMPGTSEKHGGTIRLEIALEALTETQARALALAYLKLPIQGENRAWEAAQKTYTQTDDGFCTVDIPALQKEIERQIEENEPLLSSDCPKYKLLLWENVRTKGSQTQKAIEHLQRYRLSASDGIKVYLNDGFTVENADLSLEAGCTFEDKEERIKEREPLKYIVGCVIFLVIVGIVLIQHGRNSSTTSLDVFSSHTCQMKVHGKTYEISAHVPREILLPDSLDGMIILEIQNEPSECILLLNGKRINKGADGKYNLPKQGGTLQILQPKS
ncbi:MAG: hypothetical protein IIV41_10515 [Akkermansia sp.]|nr:hypothetical protein [Akkermansia sp.]